MSTLNRVAIVPVGMGAYPYEEGKEVNITYPPTGWNETAAAGRELLKILSLVRNLSPSTTLTVSQMVYSTLWRNYLTCKQ